MVKIRNVIRKKVYVPPRVETILVENESLMDISVYAPNQEAPGPWGAKSSQDKLVYRKWEVNFSDEYEDDSQEFDDLDEILYRLR